MGKHLDTDILIIGGGMVGACLACVLNTSGYRAALIESRDPRRARQADYDDRTTVLSQGSKRILRGIGLWERIAPLATPIRTIHVSEAGRPGVARLSHTDADVEALGYVVPNHHIVGTFYDYLRGCDAVEVLAPASLGEWRRTPQAIHADVTQQRALSVTARLLVAADGANSSVRQQCGLEAETIPYGQIAIVANVTPELHHANRAFERFTGRGPLALVPLSEGRCALIWTQPPATADTIMACPEREFLLTLQRAFGYRLGRFIRVGTRSSYPLVLMYSKQLTDHRVVLIGNAAHTLHPVAGQGFNLALRDVAELAERLRHAYRHGLDPGGAAVIRNYAAARQHDIARTVTFTDGLARFFTNPCLPIVHARTLGRGAVAGLPVLRRRFARRHSGLVGNPSRLACGLPLAQDDNA